MSQKPAIPRIHPSLQDAVRENNLWVFVGAGLSQDLENEAGQKIGGWKDLLQNLFHSLSKNDGYSIDHLIPILHQYDPMDVLALFEKDIVRENIKQKDINKFLEEYLALSKDNDLSVHQKLGQLSKKIITTNYDQAFETTKPGLKVAKVGKDYEMSLLWDPNEPTLFKLHGCISDPSNLVFGTKDYRDLYENQAFSAQNALMALSHIIYSKTILFIGYQLGDPQIKKQFATMQKLLGDYNQSHFIITTDDLDSELKEFLIPLKIEDYGQTTSVIDQLLEIKREKEDTSEIATLKQLQQTIKEKEILEKKPNSIENKLALKAIKYFSKGLKFNLSNQPAKAAEQYEIAVDFKLDNPEAYNNWGFSLSELAKMPECTDKEKLLQEANEKYASAIEYKPDDHQPYNNWGVSLAYLAKMPECTDKESLLQEANEKYAKAIEYKPDDHQAYYNWGVSLYELSKMPECTDKEKLLQEANEKYASAIEYKPDIPQAYNNWGLGLYELSKMPECTEKESLLQEANEKYAKAIEYKPDDHQAYYNWGLGLYDLAKMPECLEKESLLQESNEKYAKAIEYKPDIPQAYNNWGLGLLHLLQIKAGEDTKTFYQKAYEKFKQAIQYGGSSYNLSCTYARLKDKAKAFEFLETSLSRGEISAQEVEQDKAWEAYDQDPDFVELINRYR